MSFNTKKTCRILFLGAILFLNACATGINLGDKSQDVVFSTKGGTYKVGKPYKVLGSWYYPKEDFDYNEVGTASWYGADFHAKYTANGERYDMNTLTAAHKTLPLPCIVRVTNLENGRSLILRVNDRGPFVGTRIIDISKRGAQLLGFQNQGTAKVRVQVMKEESQRLKMAILNKEDIKFTLNNPSVNDTPKIKTATAAKPVSKNITGSGKQFFVQAGAFSSEEIAGTLSRQLYKVGNVHTSPADVNGNRFYRVRVGPYNDEAEAHLALSKVQNYGVAEATIIKD